MNIYSFDSGCQSNSFADLREVPRKKIPLESGEEIVENLPGEISFQWNKSYKKRPDVILILAYYPVISNRLKEFLESQSFTGLGFFRAYEIKAGLYSKEPTEQTDIWWVAHPTKFIKVDKSLFYGDDLSICPRTSHFIKKNPRSAINLPRRVLPLEQIMTDFFGLANTPWFPLFFCTEFVAETLRKKKITNLELNLASPM